MKAWGGRFTKETNSLVEEYTASITFDQVLALDDIEGSIAHATMLGECGILPADQAQILVNGLKSLAQKHSRGELKFSIHDEDIHMNIERMLREQVGDLAGKLHTARSRNDQVATDMRLYLRRETIELAARLMELERALISQAEKHLDTILPGYTHLQRAQPVLLAHHLLAYAWMFQRDLERYTQSWKRINVLPLGAGALAGTGFPINRERVAELLCFDAISENSMDAVSDRDFIVEFLANSSLCIAHLSRFSEEIILWSSQEFGFIELDDAFCTGSSIMPQKKNPDVAELVRGKSGRIYGSLIGLLTVLKSLPLSYNKDLQEDKEGMFDTAATLQGALALFAPMIAGIKINSDKMRCAAERDFSNATDLADYLAKKGIPFRQAHEIVGKAVRDCIENDKFLADLSLQEFKGYSECFAEDVYSVLEIKSVVDARNSRGGTARSQVETQLDSLRGILNQNDEWISEHRAGITTALSERRD